MTISVPMCTVMRRLRYLSVHLCILGNDPGLQGVWVALLRQMKLLPGSRLISVWVIARLLKFELKMLTGVLGEVMSEYRILSADV